MTTHEDMTDSITAPAGRGRMPRWECIVTEECPGRRPPPGAFTVEQLASLPRYAARAAAADWQRKHGRDYVGRIIIWVRVAGAEAWGRPFVAEIARAGYPADMPPLDLVEQAIQC
jgi:hypothetical protein